MFDQSFSAKNFYNILLVENRKGNNREKEFFEENIYKKYTLKIRDINNILKKNLNTFKNQYGKNPSNNTFKRYKRFLRLKKKELKKEKEENLLVELEEVSKNVQKTNFRFHLTQKTFKGKAIYTLDSNPETYFAIKQLQYNFHKLYKVKQANRFEIVNQVKCLLNDKFPKIIIRTDIKGFYENIPNLEIIKHLNAGNLLSPQSKKFIKQILRNYESISGVLKGKGIPRGIGISAYLSEYYMRKIDRKINNLQDVTYYARYVDDILIIFTPKHSYDSNNYLNQVKDIIETNQQIKLNEKKTTEISFLPGKNGTQTHSPIRLDYLGYCYELFNNENIKKIPEIEIYLTSQKIKRYKKKIKISFETFNRYKDKKKAYRHLKNRIKFLTGNVRLINNKSNVLVGIYFSNMLLTQEETLEELDKYLHWYIIRFVNKESYKERLLKYNFVKGFAEKRFYKFNQNQYKQITKIWKMI